MRRTDRLRQVAVWLVLVGALGLAVLFVGVRLTTPSDGARIAFYGDGWTAGGVRIAPIDDPATGLQGGDRIVAVDGRSVDAWLGALIDDAVARPVPAETVPYDLIRDDAALVSIEVGWTTPAIGATLLEGWSVVAFSLAVASVAAFVFARRPEEPAATALMLAAAGAAGSSVPWFLGTTVSDIVAGGPFLLHAVVTGPLYLLLWPAALHLALVFPTPLPAIARQRWIVPAVYLTAFAGYALATAATAALTANRLEWVGTWPTVQLALVVPCSRRRWR